MEKFVLAIDSFKGCLTSLEAEQAAERGIRSADSRAEIISIPVSDGGEGMLEAFCAALGGMVKHASCHDPMMRPITAAYGLITRNDGLKTAVVEVAQVIGLSLVDPMERNILKATSYGVGELICDAMQQGCTRLIVGLGGSATSDCGMGMLRALIDHFGGENFDDVKSRFSDLYITLACDVQNPLCGANGAAHVFAPQKGADAQQVRLLDRRAQRFAALSAQHFGYDRSLQPGAGAAGGLGYALMQYLGAERQSGIELLLDLTSFDQCLIGASCVVTGEGRADRQTLMGKLPQGILQRARRKGVRTILIAGQIADKKQLLEAGFDTVLCINPENTDIAQAMDPLTAVTRIEETLRKWLCQIQSL